jgi:hypothetical protein
LTQEALEIDLSMLTTLLIQGRLARAPRTRDTSFLAWQGLENLESFKQQLYTVPFLKPFFFYNIRLSSDVEKSYSGFDRD